MMKLHLDGGIAFMAPLTVLFIINLVLIGREFARRFSGKAYSAFRLDAIKQVALLALVWGAFATLIAFFYAFKSLSALGDSVPFSSIMGGLSVALITVNYGFIIFTVSMIARLVLSYLWRDKSRHED